MNTPITYPFSFLKYPHVYNSLAYAFVAGRFINRTLECSKYICAFYLGYFVVSDGLKHSASIKIVDSENKIKIFSIAEQPKIIKIFGGFIAGYLFGPIGCMLSVTMLLCKVSLIQKMVDSFIVFRDEESDASIDSEIDKTD
jgi:hypothetical protein